MERDVGQQAEDWVRQIAHQYKILIDPPCSFERLVRLLDENLQVQLNLARPFLENAYPAAGPWLDGAIRGKVVSKQADPRLLLDVTARLLDLALCTDLLVRVRDNNGRHCLMAIDVTCNPAQVQPKLNLIQGKREDGDRTRFNRMQKLPAVRRELGIDKHLVLALDFGRLPDPVQLVEELYAAANRPARTQLIDLNTPVQVEEVAQQSDQTQPIRPSEVKKLSRLVRTWLGSEGEPTASGGLRYTSQDRRWEIEAEPGLLLITLDRMAVLVDNGYLALAAIPVEHVPLFEALARHVQSERRTRTERDWER